jgi:hypothetical protein
MPAFIYRWYFGADSVKSLQRNILRLCGVRPVRETLIGNVEGCCAAKRGLWLAQMHEPGRCGA